MGNTCFSVVPFQHLLLPRTITALLLVSGLKDNVASVRLIMFQTLVRADYWQHFPCQTSNLWAKSRPHSQLLKLVPRKCRMSTSIQRRATKLLRFIHVSRMAACASFNGYRCLQSTCPLRNAPGHLRDIL